MTYISWPRGTRNESRAPKVVLAPFGVASTADANQLSRAIDARSGPSIVVVPAGRPYLPAESAGMQVRRIGMPRTMRSIYATIVVGCELRRAIKADSRSVVVWANDWSLAPYEALLKSGAWCLGSRSIRRVRNAKLVDAQRLRPSVVVALQILATNAIAYRAMRRTRQRASVRDLPLRNSTPIRRLLYVRTDLAFMYSAVPGGSTSHTEGVVGGLIDNGAEVTVASPRLVPVVNRKPPTWVKITPHPRPNVHVELVRALADEAVERDLLSRSPRGIDAIYARYSLFNAAAMTLARARRLPLILEFNCSEAKFDAGGVGMTFQRRGLEVEAELCRSASLVVVVSNRVADEVRALAPTARVLVAPNAVDVTAFEVGDDMRHAERVRLGVPDDDVLVGFVGRFYVWHGVDTLASAATTFLADRPNSRLLLVGDGPYRERAIRALAPWGERVIAPGIVGHAQIPRVMSACDILAAPHAPIDGFVGSPMKLFEYLASGRAIVASRLEQLAEIITHERTGLLVTPGDVPELSDAIVRLIDDVELRERLGRNGRAEAMAKHTWQARVRTILDAVEGSPLGVSETGTA